LLWYALGNDCLSAPRLSRRPIADRSSCDGSSLGFKGSLWPITREELGCSTLHTRCGSEGQPVEVEVLSFCALYSLSKPSAFFWVYWCTLSLFVSFSVLSAVFVHLFLFRYLLVNLPVAPVVVKVVPSFPVLCIFCVFVFNVFLHHQCYLCIYLQYHQMLYLILGRLTGSPSGRCCYLVVNEAARSGSGLTTLKAIHDRSRAAKPSYKMS